MMIDTTIYGYTWDGGAYHVVCLPARAGDPSTNPDIAALFSYHDDDPHGLTCDACEEAIFDPMPEHQFDPFEGGLLCVRCGQPEDDELLHPYIAPKVIFDARTQLRLAFIKDQYEKGSLQS